MDDLQNILNLFGLEFHSCKFEGKELPKLVLVVDPQKTTVSDVKSAFLSLPAVAFNVSIISGTEYCGIAVPNIEKRSDGNGWSLLSQKGYCAYANKEKAVCIGYPYPEQQAEGNLLLELAIIHELGHYKQEMLYGATIETCNSTILEYHNIMFNENKPRVKVNIKNYRTAYNKGNRNCISPESSQLISFKSITDTSYTIEIEQIEQIKKTEIIEINKSKFVFFNSLSETSKKLLSAIENKVNVEDKINQILLYNLLVEVNVIGK